MSQAKTTASTDVVDLEAGNRVLRSEVQGLRQCIAAMHDLGETADSPPPDADVLKVLDQALTALRRAVGAEDSSLLILDEETDELVFVLTHGEVPPAKLAWRRLPRSQGIASWVARNRCAAVVNDPKFDERFCPWLDEEFEFQTRSVLAAPLISRGRVLGVIEVLNKHNGMNFSTDDLQILSVMCPLAGEILSTFVERLQTAPPEPPNDESSPGG